MIFCFGIVLLSAFLLVTVKKEKLLYYFKFLIFIIGVALNTIILLPIIIIFPFDIENLTLLGWGHRKIFKLIGIQTEIRGQQNIVHDTGSVILINHQSSLDVLAFSEILQYIPRTTAIMKKEVLFGWPGGITYWLSNIIFINRANSDKARQTLKDVSTKIINDKIHVLICPEGTRYCSDKLLTFKKGAFHLAINSQVPIQPIVISSYKFVNHTTRIFNSGNLVINILPPIKTAGLTIDDVNKLTETTYEIMNKEYETLNK